MGGGGGGPPPPGPVPPDILAELNELRAWKIEAAQLMSESGKQLDKLKKIADKREAGLEVCTDEELEEAGFLVGEE